MVSFAFLAAVAFSAVPSPLCGLYRARDHFSLFIVTVIYAVYAIGLIGALLLAGHLSDWYGRRRLLLPALGTAICSAIVFLASKSLPGLLVARLLNGTAIGIIVSTGTSAVGTVMSIAPPDRITESLAGLFLAGFAGQSLPVVGLGITLSRHVTPKVTLLGFAIVVSAGIAASAINLVGRTTTRTRGAPTPAGRGADAPDATAGHQ